MARFLGVSTPMGKMRVCINMLYEQHINAKKIEYETVTCLGAIIGIKRKREKEDEMEKEKKKE